MKKEMFTFAEAARILGMSRTGVVMLVERGLIRSEPYGPTSGIQATEVERYQRERRPRGRPQREKTTAA